jgi:CheY-like chemotaxis protein
MTLHKKILLVDDDTDDQYFFVDALRETYPDVQCVIANNGLEAILQLKTIAPTPSIIFLDLNMPFMNGYECLEDLKKDDSFKNIPVIIYSTTNNSADYQRIKEMGAKAFLSKPADFDILKSKLAEILKLDFSIKPFLYRIFFLIP